MNNLPNLIVRLSQNPYNSELNFDVAEEYLANNQTASAVSFYLRSLEYGSNKSPKGYAALLRMANCFDDQKGRELSVTNCLLQALAYDDTRPEAYWLLSHYYERAQQWQEAYTFAILGLGWVDTHEPLPIDIGFNPKYSLLFQQGVTAWWIGRKDESIKIFQDLIKAEDLPQNYKEAVASNLERISA